MRLTQEKGRELAGVGAGPLQVLTESELARHNTEADAWTAIDGKVALMQPPPILRRLTAPRQVYNITPYLHFHPGGKLSVESGG